MPDLGWVYVPFAVLVLVGASNSVNLTDGLDGLAISVFTVAAVAFTALVYISGHAVFASYLLLIRFPPAAELTIFCGSLVGAGLGFLWYNSYPADVFMGDVGSLALGGALGTVALLIKQELLLPNRRCRVRHRGPVRDHPGGVIQDDGPTSLQDGAASSSLRIDRVERTEGDQSVSDHRGRVCTVQPHDTKTAVRSLRTMPEFSVAGSRVVVVGAARSGVAAAELLARRGARVTMSEVREAIDDPARLQAAGVTLELGGHRPETLASAELIVLSPGVSPRLQVVDRERRRGTPVISEVELAARWLQGRIVAVTGTKGKSTTAVLTGRMIDADGKRALVGGNVGTALSSQVDESSPDVIHVVEVSSFQLELVQSFHPWIAVCLNLSPDHLDRHASFQEYVDAKARIFVNQTSTDAMVINADDPVRLGDGAPWPRAAGALCGDVEHRRGCGRCGRQHRASNARR